ncbi:UbiA family prenyltransferase [Tunturiibacter gelidiferens]|uniref:UbiA family prenyltransferase n=1 Tax=Tunturiibacter gelidiferens TaxID=3069689 RepID=UPI003D9B25E5
MAPSGQSRPQTSPRRHRPARRRPPPLQPRTPSVSAAAARHRPPHLPRHRRRRRHRPPRRRPPRPLHRRPRLRRPAQPRRQEQTRRLPLPLRRQLHLHRQRHARPHPPRKLQGAHGRQPHPRSPRRPSQSPRHPRPHLRRDRLPLKAWPKAIRLHQWAKNVLIFLPLLLAHNWTPGILAGAALAFFSFGLCASATYIVNDLLDLEADRQHPRKRRRPFASGDLSALSGIAVIALFLTTSLALALLVPLVISAISPDASLIRPHHFLLWLGIYLVTTLAYSLRLKRSVLVDVIVLSGLYTVRIIAGSAATGIPVSTWLAGFSIFFFLSLAFVKRFAELENLSERGGSTVGGRGYHVSDIEQLRSFGTASGYASVVVLTLYISNLDAAQLYHHTNRLWLLVPVLLLWISRLWFTASRGQLDEDPVVYAITDRRSLLLGLLVVLIVLSAL